MGGGSTWTAENLLCRMQTRTDLPPSLPQITLDFKHDYLGGRIRKTVTTGGVVTHDRQRIWIRQPGFVNRRFVMTRQMFRFLLFFLFCFFLSPLAFSFDNDEISLHGVGQRYMTELRPILIKIKAANTDQEARLASEELIAKYGEPQKFGYTLNYTMVLTRNAIWQKKQLLAWQEVAAEDYREIFKSIKKNEQGQGWASLRSMFVEAYRDDPLGILKKVEDTHFIDEAIKTYSFQFP